MRAAVSAIILLAGCATIPADQPVPSSGIIDAHRHTFEMGTPGGSVDDMLAKMDAAGIDRAAIHFVTRDSYDDWAGGHEARFLKGVSLPCWRNGEGEYFSCNWGESGFPDIAWLRSEAEAGRLTHLGEMGLVYAGIDPNDPRLAPYWDLAAEFDLPVMVHINRGPPPANPMRARGCCPDFDSDMGNPELLRPVLERHPDLRIVLQHFGFPPMPMFDDIGYVEESFALLRDFPGVMADMSAFQSVPFVTPEQHAATVRRLKEEGLLDRLIFGSDGWPEAAIIARYEAMDFLTVADRRAIFHDNAARLFSLDER